MFIGDLELHLVSDGLVQVDAGGPFGLVPRGLYEQAFPPRADNTITMALTCLLIRSRGRTILVDTGLGDKLSAVERERWQIDRPTGGLLEGLRGLGVGPDDIDVVVNTHLHADHCGGNTVGAAAGLAAAFPRATYWVQRIEWADASHPDARTRGTYHADNFEPLVREGRMKLLHGDAEVTDQVRCVVTRGHTRGHQSVVLASGGWRGLYPADLASYALHFERSAWMTAYDVEPLETLRTKTIWREWAARHRAWLFFEHDAERAVGRLVARDGNGGIEPIPEAAGLTGSLPTPRPLRG